ncbi:MAG TPA: LON peptidase substrate-binding domain-containing protein [Polyangiaceae bacterium]|jgi:Lon protease-like protein|nr:LON peptidase substrate-binding domain-containing protein [Polyangiaceae bacterium]
MPQDGPEAPPLELTEVPVFPLPNVVLLPGGFLPLHVFEPRYREMTRDVVAGRRCMAVARLQPGFEADYEGRPPIHPLCGVGEVVKQERRADGRWDIVLRGLGRVRIREELPATLSYRVVRVEWLEDVTPKDRLALSAFQQELSTCWSRLAPYLPTAVRDICQRSRDDEAVGAWADRVAATLIADPDERQLLLEELDPGERLCRLVERLHELSRALNAGAAVPSSALN